MDILVTGNENEITIELENGQSFWGDLTDFDDKEELWIIEGLQFYTEPILDDIMLEDLAIRFLTCREIKYESIETLFG